jgi:molecular chaperone HscB
LEEVFELNMALEELREGDASARPQLVEAQKRFQEMRHEIDEELAALFTKFDASEDAVFAAAVREIGGWHSPEILPEIRAALDRRRYISNLLRDVDKELNVHVSN